MNFTTHHQTPPGPVESQWMQPNQPISMVYPAKMKTPTQHLCYFHNPQAVTVPVFDEIPNWTTNTFSNTHPSMQFYTLHFPTLSSRPSIPIHSLDGCLFVYSSAAILLFTILLYTMTIYRKQQDLRGVTFVVVVVRLKAWEHCEIDQTRQVATPAQSYRQQILK